MQNEKIWIGMCISIVWSEPQHVVYLVTGPCRFSVVKCIDLIRPGFALFLLKDTMLLDEINQEEQYYMGHVKWKIAFWACTKFADSYHPALSQILIWAFALYWNILSIQWFGLRTVEALIRLHRCAGWSGPLLSTEDTFCHGTSHVL